jgi:hypothetical protein
MSSEGTPSSGNEADGRLEFTTEEEVVVGELSGYLIKFGRAYRAFGWVLVVFLVLMGLAGLAGGRAALYVVGVVVVLIPVAAVLLGSGGRLRDAGSAFNVIVTTQGEDREYLFKAIQSVSRGFQVLMIFAALFGALTVFQLGAAVLAFLR